MTTRRDFLKGATAAATGIVFCGCGMLEAAHAQHPGGRRLPVAVNGKRIKTIDVHAHCYFRESTSLVSPESIFTPPTDATRDSFIEIESRLKAMDAQAVDMEVLSINPFWYGRDRELGAQVVKLQNEKLAELCASKPDRFAAFASLTLQAPDLAVQELETAVKKQGLKGAAIGGSVNGVDLRLTPADANDPEMRGLMSRRLARTVQKTKPGDPIELRVYANGQTKTIKVTSVKASELFNEGFLRVGQSDWDAPELGSLMLQYGPMIGDPSERPFPPIPPMPPMPPGGGPGHDGGAGERQFHIGAPAAPAESVRADQEVEL